MKLLFVENARVTWLFQTRSINPGGLDLQPLFRALVEKFRFASVPKHSNDFDESGALVFNHGSFTNSQGNVLQVALKVYNDGVIAETISNTDDCADFLEQLCSTVAEEGFLPPVYTDAVQLGFYSQIRVVCDRPLVTINPKLGRIATLLDSAVRTLDGKPRKFEVAGIELHAEDVGKPLAPVSFRFERKHGIPFSENQYYSVAPLETDKHLEFLNMLEQILKD